MHLSVIPFCFPGISGVSCAFTGRAFGNVSLDFAAQEQTFALRQETVRAREAFLSLPGVKAFAEVHQVHGIRTIFEPEIQPPAEPSVVDADGLAASRPGLALMVKTADCQPILIAHESGRFVMALHSGWKGNRQEYPRIAVQEFCEQYGVRPGELWAVRGPSLGPSASEFVNFESEWGEDFRRWYDAERRTVDLWRLTCDQLTAAGMRSERILGLDICTFSNVEHFFSYRQFRRNAVADGRQASLIWIR